MVFSGLPDCRIGKPDSVISHFLMYSIINLYFIYSIMCTRFFQCKSVENEIIYIPIMGLRNLVRSVNRVNSIILVNSTNISNKQTKQYPWQFTIQRD